MSLRNWMRSCLEFFGIEKSMGSKSSRMSNKQVEENTSLKSAHFILNSEYLNEEVLLEVELNQVHQKLVEGKDVTICLLKQEKTYYSNVSPWKEISTEDLKRIITQLEKPSQKETFVHRWICKLIIYGFETDSTKVAEVLNHFKNLEQTLLNDEKYGRISTQWMLLGQIAIYVMGSICNLLLEVLNLLLNILDELSTYLSRLK